jgi:hypothetical protein
MSTFRKPDSYEFDISRAFPRLSFRPEDRKPREKTANARSEPSTARSTPWGNSPATNTPATGTTLVSVITVVTLWFEDIEETTVTRKVSVTSKPVVWLEEFCVTVIGTVSVVVTALPPPPSCCKIFPLKGKYVLWKTITPKESKKMMATEITRRTTDLFISLWTHSA